MSALIFLNFFCTFSRIGKYFAFVKRFVVEEMKISFLPQSRSKFQYKCCAIAQFAFAQYLPVHCLHNAFDGNKKMMNV
jgi:hypothetical protein